MRERLLVSALLIALPVTFLAQAGPAFDVISIKPNRTNQGIPVVAFQPGGRMIAGNVVVRQVIQVAYGLEDLQLVNAPDWTATERFAIEARTADDTPTNTIRLMLRAMLADRFGFAAHQERRELPIYALTMARPDKRLGARLRPSGPECAPIRPPEGAYASTAATTAAGQWCRSDSAYFSDRRTSREAMRGHGRSGLALGAQHHDGGVHEASVAARGSSPGR